MQINVTKGLAIYECICSVNCTENCKEMNHQKEMSLGMKYCPGLDILLPVYNHIEYKPRYSTKRNNIFKLDNNRNTNILLAQSMLHVKQDHMVLGYVDNHGRGDGRLTEEHVMDVIDMMDMMETSMVDRVSVH